MPMNGAVHPRFHPAGFDGALRTALDDVRAGRWRSTSELLRNCRTWGVRTSRSQVLAAAVVAAQGDAVEAWLQEEPSADALMMRARVRVQQALGAHRAGKRGVGLLADRARAACFEAARYGPADPVPWVCLVALAQLDWPEEGRRRPEHRAQPPEGMLPFGPWVLLHEADKRDPGSREAWHRMIQALRAYGVNVRDVARWICSWAPDGSPLLLLPLYLQAEHYAKERARGALTPLYWTTDLISHSAWRALEGWFWCADRTSWSAQDLGHLAQALFSTGLYAEAAPVFEVIGPFVTPEPWKYIAEAPDLWLEQFERARDKCLAAATGDTRYAARRR
ncbi:hypothetical protein [Streptomyces pseudovenezuelae]|uniref:DUF4034 domain-containing protein n=1 Tax=Streptomyces pseudovenezuelae TaxID=67350 RepID=A0ABT6LES3_9ACTN|nr:hypothetical protein [Streptomyces pseudovenezuelae]MDH6214106.1 hypothetical protein [Streptomyces pseudovenezuelae]